MMAGLLSAPAEVFVSEYFARQRTVRRALKRWWIDSPKRWVAWLMLNPSDADARADDPTTRRLTHFTSAWGYDGWIAVNLYPFVSSRPDAMWRRADWQANGPDWEARDDLQANLRDIEAAGRMAALRVVAFGAQPAERDEAWLEMALEAFSQPANNDGADERFYCLGCNQRGQPLHPMARGRMRVSDAQQPIIWERASMTPAVSQRGRG